MTVNSLGLFINQNRQMLMAYAMTMVGNKYAAEDLVSDVTVKALSRTEQLKDEDKTSVLKWLYTIMKTTFYDQTEKAVRHGEVDLEATTDEDGCCDWGAYGVSDYYTDSAAEYHDVVKVLNSLDENLRTAIKLFAAGVRVEDIAKRQKVTVVTVYNRIKAARAKMQQMMAA